MIPFPTIFLALVFCVGHLTLSDLPHVRTLGGGGVLCKVLKMNQKPGLLGATTSPWCRLSITCNPSLPRSKSELPPSNTQWWQQTDCWRTPQPAFQRCFIGHRWNDAYKINILIPLFPPINLGLIVQGKNFLLLRAQSFFLLISGNVDPRSSLPQLKGFCFCIGQPHKCWGGGVSWGFPSARHLRLVLKFVDVQPS